MSDIQRDIEKLERLTAVANASLATSAVILTAHSNAANVVGSTIGGDTVNTLSSGGISALSGSLLGGASLMTATGGIGAGSALGTALSEGTIEIIIKIILEILKIIFGSEDDKKQAEKLKDELNRAIEAQNKIVHKLEALCEQVKQELVKGKEINPDKINEFLAINYAIKDMVKELKENYAV